MSTYAIGTYATTTYGGASTVIPGLITAFAAAGARATAAGQGSVIAANGGTAA